MILGPNINVACAQLLLEEYARCGGRHVFATPGSRSAPLAVAAARSTNVALHMCVDERTASFAALGAVRTSGAPAVVFTTSGTAVANVLPSVVEANESGLPLLVLSADRPAELLECGANQAIRQESMFGSQVRWAFQLPVPRDGADARVWLSAMDQAMARAQGTRPGPVHLNLPLDEPLAPIDVPFRFEPAAAVDRWLGQAAPWRRHHTPHVGLRDASALEAILCSARDGVIVVGAIDNPEEAYHARALAQRAPWPVIADLSSGLRAPVNQPRTLRHGSLLLRSASACAGGVLPRPDVVLRVGGPCAWRHVDEWCASAGRLVVAGTGTRFDPCHSAADHAPTSLAELSALEGWKDCESSASTGQWERADQLADAVLRQGVELTEGPLTEPAIAAAVLAHLPDGAVLVAGSSMPVRDLEAFGGGIARSGRCMANRGASGIDGTLATAAGASIASGEPVVALVGDLATLHDLSSLELLRRVPAPVLLVVVNNDGGGIFESLPIASHADVVGPAFTTPHGLGFAGAATMFGLGYRRVTTGAELRTALRSGTSPAKLKRSTIVEVIVHRQSSAAARAALFARLGDELRRDA